MASRDNLQVAAFQAFFKAELIASKDTNYAFAKAIVDSADEAYEQIIDKYTALSQWKARPRQGRKVRNDRKRAIEQP